MTWMAIHDTLLDHFGPQHWWPGETPFEVMVGAVLTQNTAWTNVERAIAALKSHNETHNALSATALLGLPDAKLAALIRPAGYFNVKTRRLKALCQFLSDRGVADQPQQLAAQATLPELRKALLAVHGIGEETADSILLYALNLPSFVVDAYTRRSFTRLGLLNGDESYAAIQARFHTELPIDRALFNEFHALIVALAKHHCRPRPQCEACPLPTRCPYAKSLSLR